MPYLITGGDMTDLDQNTNPNKSELQYQFSETLKYSRVVSKELEQIRSELKPVRYVRSPNTRIYAMLQWLTIEHGYKSVNDMLDEVVRFVFLNVATKNQPIKKGELKK